MKLVRNADSAELWFNGRKVMEHTPLTPFVTAMEGSYVFRSSHGNFKVREKIKSRAPFSLVGGDENGLVFATTDGRKIEAKFCECCGGVRIDLFPSGDFVTELVFPAVAEEGIFGGGEQYRQLDMKGERIVNFVSEHIVVPPIVRKTALRFLPYKEKPHSYIETYSPMSTYTSSEKYALRFDVSSYGVADFTCKDVSVFRFEKCPRSVFYTSGESFREVSKSLNAHTPCREYIPDWAYDGIIVAVQGGMNRVTEKALDMQKRGVELAGVWCQDWSGRKVTAVGKQVYWNWEADESLYRDFDKNVASLKERGVHFLAYINPYLVKGGRLYRECAAKGMLIRDRKGEIYHVKSTTFDAGMLDLTDPAAAEFIKEILIKRNMLDRGVDGYMADFGEYLPVDCVLRNGDPASMHNEWPALWARINREAVQSHPRAKEIFFFTRSGYNGVQSHTAMMWNGDQHVDFSKDYGMPCVIPASFNLGFSGVSAVHSDAGGFISFSSLARNRELLIRWMEMNAFSPLMRSHETIRPDVNIQPYDGNVVDVTASLSKVHAALKPYLIACMEEAREGIPVMRPDFYECGDYSLHKEEYAYFLGEDVFVAPITEKGKTEREVALPAGNWIKFFDGTLHIGGNTIRVAAPLGKPIAFYRKESRFANLFASVKI